MKMNLTKASLCAALAPLLLATHAVASVITWSAPVTMVPSDASTVITNGTLVTAAWMSPTAATLPVNGVTFTDWQHAAHVSGFPPNYLANNTWFYITYPTGAPNYEKLLSYQFCAFDGNNYGDAYDLSKHPIVLSSLLPGHSYELQVWTPYQNNNSYATRYSGTAPTGPTFSTAPDDSATLNLGAVNGGGPNTISDPQFALGTFTADATTQTLYFHGNVDSVSQYAGEIGAFELRDVTIPE